MRCKKALRVHVKWCTRSCPYKSKEGQEAPTNIHIRRTRSEWSSLHHLLPNVCSDSVCTWIVSAAAFTLTLGGKAGEYRASSTGNDKKMSKKYDFIKIQYAYKPKGFNSAILFVWPPNVAKATKLKTKVKLTSNKCTFEFAKGSWFQKFGPCVQHSGLERFAGLNVARNAGCTLEIVNDFIKKCR